MDTKLIILSGPSGSGKTTLANHLLDCFPNIEFSISACSRPKRDHEIHGGHYYFFSPESFQKKISEEAFLEWEEVYPGKFYGTLVSEIDRIGNKGHHVLFDVDVIGGLTIKKKHPSRSLCIFIMPPSTEELKKRLAERQTEDKDSLQTRISKAQEEMSYADQFDIVLHNIDLEKAKQRIVELVKIFLHSSS